jgi:fibronectin type 3 domain-containing protein
MAESARSEYTVVVPKDIFPPLPAANLNAVQDGNAVLLLWQPSPSGDVEEYRVYRSRKPEQKAELLRAAGTIQYSFRDTEVVSGVQYTYTVEAIDRYGNKSDGVTAEIALR